METFDCLLTDDKLNRFMEMQTAIVDEGTIVWWNHRSGRLSFVTAKNSNGRANVFYSS